jgi:tetratricopeptide (TPR) repeat protein
MEKEFEQIERYFEGGMSPEESAAFEKARLDPNFDREVQLYMQARDLIRKHAGERMKRNLNELGRQEFAFDTVRSFTFLSFLRKYKYANAAVLLILVTIGYFGFRNTGKGLSQQSLAGLYNRYYEVPSAAQVVTRGDMGADSLAISWETALQKYNDKLYDQAALDFRQLLNHPEFSMISGVSFYLGICYLQKDLPDSAVVYFEKVSPNSSLAQDAIWYKGMAYLKAGNPRKAEEVFSTITGQSVHFKMKEANKISRYLGKQRDNR